MRCKDVMYVFGNLNYNAGIFGNREKWFIPCKYIQVDKVVLLKGHKNCP